MFATGVSQVPLGLKEHVFSKTTADVNFVVFLHSTVWCLLFLVQCCDVADIAEFSVDSSAWGSLLLAEPDMVSSFSFF